ncbi:hypothetical protein Pelo_767 [Pelomyxa schiedti]|nr:hypothetical protein Pelo_767 [Pelomyxa schiedti]
MQNTSPPLYWDPAEFGTLQQKPKKPRKIETRTLSGRLHPRGCHCLNEWPLKTDSSGNYVTNCDGYQIHLQPTVNGHTEWPCAPYPNHTYDECPLQILGKHPEAKERVKQQVLEKHNRLLQEWTAQGRKKDAGTARLLMLAYSQNKEATKHETTPPEGPTPPGTKALTCAATPIENESSLAKRGE